MSEHDEVETRERRTWRSTEPSWALWEVQRMSSLVAPVIAARMGLPPNDVRALALLVDSASGIGPVELGQQLGMRSASATELVDRLESAGHVRRTRHPRDRRRVLVEITDHGRAGALAALGPMLERFDRVAAGMSAQAQEAVVTYLRAIAAEQRAFYEEAHEGSQRPEPDR